MVAKLGNFLVDIDTSVNEKGIISLTKSLGGLAKKGAKFGTALAGGVAAAGAGFTKLVKGTVEQTAELGRLAEDLGVTTNFLETFIRSFESVGAGGEEAISTVRTLKKEIEAFKFGKGNIEAFGILGINPQDLGDDVSGNFTTIRKRFNELTEAQRLYFVDQIGLGEKSLRVLRLTDKEYQALQKTSSQFPLATQDQIDSSEEFFQNTIRIGQSFKALKRSLVLDVTPAFTKFSDELIDLFADPKFQENVGGFFDQIFDVALPKIVEATPIIVDNIGKMAGSVSSLSNSLDELANNPFIKFLGKTGGAVVSGYTALFKGLGNIGADIIDFQIENMIDPSTGKPSRSPQLPTTEELKQESMRLRGISNSTNQQVVSGGDTTYNINIPLQKIGEDVTDEDRLAIKIADEIDKRNQQESENFKSGVIQ
jgi:hypothetical protein